jgi:60 kDa SS-A/Ro ribonucleoprotein
MVSKNLFKSAVSTKKAIKSTDTINNAGGVAYTLDDKAALAQLAMTGCFNGTYYVSGEDQLTNVVNLANKLPAEYVAKLAVYARKEGFMKDMPAVLAAVVANKDVNLLTKIFPLVIDNPKMVRNFVQVIRSGVTGRKSLGTRPKKLIQNYLASLTDEQLFKADVGNSPSLQDIIKLARPKPGTKSRSALYGYLLDKEHNKSDLCSLVTEFESFKKELGSEVPDVPFQMLTALPLTNTHWKSIAKDATWNQTRMNLNTFARHDVLKDTAMVNSLAERLADATQIKKAKVFPYQLFSAFLNVNSDVPKKLTVALQKAADSALENIPELTDKIYIMVDTSGSMYSPITGHRGSVTTKMRCVDVAGLMASALMRKNQDVEIIPFDTSVHKHNLNPMDSIMTNAQKLASYGGGGTSCSIAIKHLNDKKAKGDLLIMVSDNESWIDTSNSYYGTSRGTETMNEWVKFKARNSEAKFVCIDITPNKTVQAVGKDILNIGGFNDSIFDVVAMFQKFGSSEDLWVKTIENVSLD